MSVHPMPRDTILDREYRRIKAETEAAVAEGQNYMGPCETCRHFLSWNSMIGPYRACKNPLAISVKFDRDRGKLVTRPFTMTDGYKVIQPGEPPACGPNHLLWERKPTLLERFIAWLASLLTPSQEQ